MPIPAWKLWLLAPLCAVALTAVINTAFDYVPYLDALQKHGLNYTRFYAGAMFETIDKFITCLLYTSDAADE